MYILDSDDLGIKNKILINSTLIIGISQNKLEGTYDAITSTINKL